MHNNTSTKVLAGLIAAILTTAGACQRNRDVDNSDGGSAQVASASTGGATRSGDAVNGSIEDVDDSLVAPVPGRWLTDANLLSLFSIINSAQLAAANIELNGGRSDSVRALALAVSRQHTSLQHSADSLSAELALVPVAPALGQQITTRLQARTDSLNFQGGGAGTQTASLDRSYLDQQTHSVISDYVRQIRGIALNPALQEFFNMAAGNIDATRTHATALQRAFAAADSAVAARGGRAP